MTARNVAAKAAYDEYMKMAQQRVVGSPLALAARLSGAVVDALTAADLLKKEDDSGDSK